MRDYFLKTQRIGFSRWNDKDLPLAIKLWGEPDVTRFICATGLFAADDIRNRLETEIRNDRLHQVQYWPIFKLASGELIGCCGVRPFPAEEPSFEIGFHLRKAFWGKGYAGEAARAVIEHCFNVLGARRLYAGHHPQNAASKRLLEKLGFHWIGDRYYEPTGLYHPSYELMNPKR